MSNTTAQRPRFSTAISTQGYQNLINRTLSDPIRAKRFIANISSAVATNPALQACEPGSILAGGLLGESLGLSPSPQLGEFYLVPYKDTKASKEAGYEVMKAQFQIGYIGLMQLAMNTGLYRRIHVVTVKKGELIKYDPFTGESVFKPIQDPLEREVAETVGYYGYFELLNGFRSETYWTKEAIMQHADRYSKAFNRSDYEKIQQGKISKSDMWKYSSLWYASHDVMAHKTLVRQLLKTAPKSTEMQKAMVSDEATMAISDDGIVDYVGDSDIKVIAAEVNTAVDSVEVDDSTGEVIEQADEAESDESQVSMDEL